MAASASAATVTRYQASLRLPHNALHSMYISIRRKIADVSSMWGFAALAPGKLIGSLHIHASHIIDVRRTALILRCGAVRVDLLRMLIVV